MQRRDFLKIAISAAALPVMPSLASASPGRAGKAEHAILLWLPGGMGAIDTFDPKRKGDPEKNIAGAYYDSIATSVEGVQVCEHLPRVARLIDRMTIIRTLHHSVIDEHAAATNFMHTGRPVSGTVVYPSLGSVVSHELGSMNRSAPPYIIIGYPNITRGPGFLGAQYGYVYLTDTSQGPAGLSRPVNISQSRQERRQTILSNLREANTQPQVQQILQYEEITDQCFDLSGPEFNNSFNLDSEPADLRANYGGEFGQRCLLARRLVERGVRFIEIAHNLNFINGAGWDVHNDGIIDQHSLIQELDTALSALLLDLGQKRLLEKTLVVVATEFGRPASFDSGGGRGHQGAAFSCALAGGGLNHCGAYGQTCDLAAKIISNPVSVPDFFATIHAAMGIDYSKSLYDGDRPIPITDNGKPIKVLFT